ncbi:MAG: hypothetical protein M8353_11145, partial [ANME-2 cluster archaeon]|nr:hypothetical protein [ANME-2 cluster archaeon]
HGEIIKENHRLVRDLNAVQKVIESGKIRTHSNYKSHWYSFKQFDDWIQKYWIDPSYHIETRHLDATRAEPAQLAILDVGDNLNGLFQRQGIDRSN